MLIVNFKKLLFKKFDYKRKKTNGALLHTHAHRPPPPPPPVFISASSW